MGSAPPYVRRGRSRPRCRPGRRGRSTGSPRDVETDAVAAPGRRRLVAGESLEAAHDDGGRHPAGRAGHRSSIQVARGWATRRSSASGSGLEGCRAVERALGGGVLLGHGLGGYHRRIRAGLRRVEHRRGSRRRGSVGVEPVEQVLEVGVPWGSLAAPTTPRLTCRASARPTPGPGRTDDPGNRLVPRAMQRPRVEGERQPAPHGRLKASPSAVAARLPARLGSRRRSPGRSRGEASPALATISALPAPAVGQVGVVLRSPDSQRP